MDHLSKASKAIFLIIMLLPAIGWAKESLIEKCYIFDYETKECLNCDGSEDMDKLMDIINFKDSDEIVNWFFERFDSPGNVSHAILKSTQHKDRFHKYHKFWFGQFVDEGIIYDDGNYTINFYQKDCLLFDCYKQYMELRDAKGRRKWKRRVPFMAALIYPFIKDKYIIYTGYFQGGGYHNYLIIMNLSNGKLVEKYLPPDDEEGFSGAYDSYYGNFHIQYYKDGYIYLERYNSYFATDDKGKKVLPYIPRKPHRIYLLKVNF